MADAPILQVEARAPFKLYYQGPAESISAANRVGPFDILPGHADFFSVLSPGEVIIETAEEPVHFMIHNGIVAVRDDVVSLFIDM